MDNVMAFVTVIAWLFGVGAVLMVIARLIGAATYSRLEKLRDNLNGFHRTFPLGKPLCVAAVCAAWIIATW